VLCTWRRLRCVLGRSPCSCQRCLLISLPLCLPSFILLITAAVLLISLPSLGGCRCHSCCRRRRSSSSCWDLRLGRTHLCTGYCVCGWCEAQWRRALRTSRMYWTMDKRMLSWHLWCMRQQVAWRHCGSGSLLHERWRSTAKELIPCRSKHGAARRRRCHERSATRIWWPLTRERRHCPCWRSLRACPLGRCHRCLFDRIQNGPPDEACVALNLSRSCAHWLGTLARRACTSSIWEVNEGVLDSQRMSSTGSTLQLLVAKSSVCEWHRTFRRHAIKLWLSRPGLFPYKYGAFRASKPI